MERKPNKIIPAGLATVPGLDALEAVVIEIGRIPADVQVRGIGVHTDGPVPPEAGFDRSGLESAGFTGKTGSILSVPRAGQSDLVIVGLGASDDLTVHVLRDAAAAFVRAAARSERLGLRIDDLVDLDVEAAARALAEGALLARYRYVVLKGTTTHVPLTELTLDLPGYGDVEAAVAEARITARAAVVARDLANTPPGHLTAVNMGEIAVELGERFGFGVELFDKQALIDLGCGGLLGVNQGSVEEPRMIKLTYAPEGAATGHLGLVGKGIMYDSGGISLKPSDPMHLLMKMDMGGAAAVLGAFVGLRDAGVTAQVTGW
uniref:M17 family peptidase N-terminal domain-containing protein n=1 Tax=unclassified Microbacterium TaxID=2609290 RepID=UPI003016524F